MKKLFIFFILIVLALVLASIYGVIHDQITYTISPEYYTKFKFFQFGLVEPGHVTQVAQPRVLVSIVGIMATWWMGIPIGVALGIVGFVHPTTKQMLFVTMRSYLVTIMIAFIIGLIGLIYGKLYLARTGVDWSLPSQLVDQENFISVGSMHNFSYLGGIVGLAAGAVYSWRKRKTSIVSPVRH